MMAFADPISQESVSGCCRKKVVDRRNGDEEKNNGGKNPRIVKKMSLRVLLQNPPCRTVVVFVVVPTRLP